MNSILDMADLRHAVSRDKKATRKGRISRFIYSLKETRIGAICLKLIFYLAEKHTKFVYFYTDNESYTGSRFIQYSIICYAVVLKHTLNILILVLLFTINFILIVLVYGFKALTCILQSSLIKAADFAIFRMNISFFKTEDLYNLKHKGLKDNAARNTFLPQIPKQLKNLITYHHLRYKTKISDEKKEHFFFFVEIIVFLFMFDQLSDSLFHYMDIIHMRQAVQCPKR